MKKRLYKFIRKAGRTISTSHFGCSCDDMCYPGSNAHNSHYMADKEY